MVKTAKFQIIKPLDMDWKTLGVILYNLQKETRYVKNKTIALYNDWTNHCIEASSWAELACVNETVTFDVDNEDESWFEVSIRSMV